MLDKVKINIDQIASQAKPLWLSLYEVRARETLCHKSSFNPCCNVHGFFFLKTSYVSLIYKCRIVLKIFMILSVPLSASIFLNLLLIHIFRDLSPYRPFQELNMKTKCLPMCTEQLSLLQKKKNLRSQVVWKVPNPASLGFGNIDWDGWRMGDVQQATM